jgi:hypothetical protein
MIITDSHNDYVSISNNFVNTWQTKLSGQNNYHCAISATGQYMVACSDPGYVYISNNFGYSFTEYSVFGFSSSQTWTSVAISANGQYITAVMDSTSNSGFAYVSRNYGSSWSQTQLSGTALTCGRCAMSSDGKYGIMLSSTTTLYISSNYCNTWTQLTKPTGNASYAVGMCGTGQYCVLPFYNGGGVWYSTNYGANWTQSNASTGINWGNSASNEVGDRWIMSVGNSNSGLYYSTNYGATWTQSNITSNGWFVAMSKIGDRAIAAINHGTNTVNVWVLKE